MEGFYSPFITYEEKNPRKFSIEMDHPNFIGLGHPQFEVEKAINSLDEEKPSNNSIQNKTTNMNCTNIFVISNIKEVNQNENKCSSISQNINENNIINNNQNILDEKEKISNSLKENENNDSNSNEYNSGRWTNEEHQKFIEGIFKFGNEWKRVQSIIKTRSSTQARSHAQKFFLRMKKEISPTILADENLLLQYIISSTNNSANSTSLTQEQKERLFSVIRSNLKPEENQNKNNNLNNIQYINKKSKDFNLINEEEDDNLAYNKDNIINKKVIISDVGEKRKLTFCSKKRRSSDFILNDNKIFNIKKDRNHKKSMDINKSNNNFINKMALNNLESKHPFNEVNTTSNNNNLFINNNINNNNNFINNDKYINNFNNFNNYNSTNVIIQNNIYNIINNYNSINNQNNLNSNINNPINNLQNNPINNNLNIDSINLDNNHNKIYGGIESSKYKDKKEIFDFEKNNLNNKNLFENYYSFLNNENFFPNKNNHFKTYDNIDQNQNDPFNLKFENVPNDNNTINNDNMYLNHNSEEGHDFFDDDSERINFEKNNNINDRPYDD